MRIDFLVIKSLFYGYKTTIFGRLLVLAYDLFFFFNSRTNFHLQDSFEYNFWEVDSRIYILLGFLQWADGLSILSLSWLNKKLALAALCNSLYLASKVSRLVSSIITLFGILHNFQTLRDCTYHLISSIWIIRLTWILYRIKYSAFEDGKALSKYYCGSSWLPSW